MNRRQFAKHGALTLAVAGIGGPAFTAPACGPSKEKAVRVAGFVIDLAKESLPLLGLVGGHDIAELVRGKAIPALEKLKAALASTDIPESRTTLETVRNVLRGIGDALLNLPQSARLTTITGILASINVLLLTVEAFVESEMTSSVAALSAPGVGEKMQKVFEATRQSCRR